MTVGELIQLRRAAGQSQVDMAREMGLSHRAYQEIEGQGDAETLGRRHILLAERCSISLAVRQRDLDLALPAIRRDVLDFVDLMRRESDSATFASRAADLNAGIDERLPSDVSTFILRGDSLLRALRRWRKMTQIDIAQSTKLSQRYISDLENGAKTGTDAALRELAHVLDVPDSWLVSESN